MKKIAVSLVLASAMALAACDDDQISPPADDEPANTVDKNCVPGGGECQRQH